MSITPNKWNAPTGMSPNAIFIKGAAKWANGLAKQLGSNHKDITIIVSTKASLDIHDINAARSCDFFSINFDGLNGECVWLLHIAETCKFPPKIACQNLPKFVENFEEVDDGGIVKISKILFSPLTESQK